MADMADLIKADEAKMRLKKVPEWELEKKHIERTFEFDDFTMGDHEALIREFPDEAALIRRLSR